jgi:hypothetical protein
VAVYIVSGKRAVAGVKIAMVPTVVTVPATGVFACPCWKMKVLVVKGCITSVKTAPTLVLIDTPVAPSALMVLLTTGGVVSGAWVVVVIVCVDVGICVDVIVVVGVLLVQADTSKMASIMMIDIASESIFFLFI